METTLLQKLGDAITPYWARMHGLLTSAVDLERLSPIIILGNQKTGSSVIAHLLATYGDLPLAPNVHPAQDRERKLAAYTASELAGFMQREVRYYLRHEIVKENALTPAAGALLKTLPNARFAFMMRHPAHNIRSILDRVALPGQPLPIQGLHTVPGWQPIIDGSALRINADDHITALALRWKKIARIYLQYKPSFHLVRYEDFLSDKAGFVARLAKKLDVSKRTDIRSLLDHPFQPRGAHRKTPLGTFFSEDALRIINRCCRDEMHVLSYEPIRIAS